MDLQERIQNEQIALREAFCDDELPAFLLHQFGCDCAQRALLQAQHEGAVVDERSWDALNAKRAWLSGKLSTEELAQKRQAAVEAAMQAPAALSSLAFSAALAASTTPQHAIKTSHEDRLWYRRRLLWLLELYEFAGERWSVLAEGGNAPMACPTDAALDFGISSSLPNVNTRKEVTL